MIKMRITDFMEVTVVDKNGMHKMKSTEDIERYLKEKEDDYENKRNIKTI